MVSEPKMTHWGCGWGVAGHNFLVRRLILNGLLAGTVAYLLDARDHDLGHRHGQEERQTAQGHARDAEAPLS